jgi:hypothetical protein
LAEKARRVDGSLGRRRSPLPLAVLGAAGVNR